MKDSRPIATIDLHEVHIAVAHNGYLVETPEPSPHDLFVFETFEGLSRWLFANLVKPEVCINLH